MSDEHNVRIALLEQKIAEIQPIPDRVLILEQDFKSMRSDISEVKSTLYRSIKERQDQFDKLSFALTNNHEKAMSKIQSVCIYNDERISTVIQPIADDVKSIYTIAKTIAWLLSSLGVIITIATGIVMAWPK